jgi:hypothetical protein
MEINKDVQTSILEAVQDKLDPAISFADELADCLSISKDSAYRRIRGETLFDLAELEILTRKFGISLDHILGLEKSTIIFNTRQITHDDFTFEKYMESVYQNLSLIQNTEDNHLYFSARDVPPFHFYQIPELRAFKLYFWMKSFLDHPLYRNIEFDLNNLPDDLEKYQRLATKTWGAYLKVPCTEIWNYETANITLRQIEYHRQAGHINQQDSEVLCEKFRELMLHIQKQAEIGRKFTINSTAYEEGAPFTLYFNEASHNDNSILFRMGDKKMAFIIYATINYLATADPHFCDVIESAFNKTMKHAIPISTSSEKIRVSFFNKIFNKIQVLESRLSKMVEMF